MAGQGINMARINKLLNHIEDGLNKGTEHLKTEEVTPATPVDTGELRQGIRVEQSEGRKMKASITVTGVAHALEVHETNKNYREAGTGYKYLENPVKSKGYDVISKAIKEELKNNGY